MNSDALIRELKVRARVRLNRLRREDAAATQTLRDQLHAVAREVGFAHWEHARRVLGGVAAPGEDMGTFWHAPRTGILLNVWLSRHDEAQTVLAGLAHGYLLPYGRQYFIVQAPFIEALGVDPACPAWDAVGHDLTGAYGCAAWAQLCWQRLRAPPHSFEAR